jgi:hypothetical protein
MRFSCRTTQQASTRRSQLALYGSLANVFRCILDAIFRKASEVSEPLSEKKHISESGWQVLLLVRSEVLGYVREGLTMRHVKFVVLLSVLFGCGSSPPARSADSEDTSEERPRKSKKTAAKDDEDEAPAKRVRPIPKRCSKKRGDCMPPKRWVERLCQDIYPDVALHMFRPRTPWKRLYMTARAEPFNASGGMSLLGDKLEPGEEVIALRRRGNDGSFQVGDTAGYDVLRWNGACATIHDGDFSDEAPRQVRYPRLEWRLIGLDLRLALEKRPEISETYEARRKSCRGKSIGQVSQACEEDDKAFYASIVEYVQSGKRLPRPTKTP